MNKIMNPLDYGYLQFYAQAESVHQQKIKIKVQSLKTIYIYIYTKNIGLITFIWGNKTKIKPAGVMHVAVKKKNNYQLREKIPTKVFYSIRPTAIGWTAESWPEDGCRRNSNPRQHYFREASGR
jgi:hypothetical protein